MKNFSRIIVLLIFYICTQSIMAVQAQTITPANIGAIKVDELTDGQVQDLIKQAQASGQTDAQLLSLAVSKGMSETDANKLQNRINAVRNANSATSNTSNNTAANVTQPSARQLNYTPQVFTNVPPKSTDMLQVFGSDLFSNSNLTFEPNLRIPTPQNYILGPDDQLIITVYGNSQVDWKLTVSPDGNIQIPGIGLVNVSGKTIEQARGIIASKLAANNYAIGHGTSVAVSLGNIRSIKVTLTGELVKPATYTLSSLSTVLNALYASGGPNMNGSFRMIELIRGGRVFKHFDVYDFLLKGSQTDNVRLQDEDIIRVPTYKTRVTLMGQVKHPAIFEVIPGETLQNVINFSGGFTDSAYTATIKVIQVTDKERRVTDVSLSDYSNYIPLKGDMYFVDKILNRFENRVTINGAVFRPGIFGLEKGLTLSQLIAKADGLREDVFDQRGYITRLKPDNTFETIPFDTRAIVSKSMPDIPLQREDVVNIPSIFDLRDAYKVSINGQVRKGGDFAYADSMSVEELIIKAGGFTEGASPRRIEIARRVYNSDKRQLNAPVSQIFIINVDAQLKFSNSSFKLHPYDIVSVYSLPGFEMPQTVTVEGEFIYPGTYTIPTKNERISDLLKRTGGLTAYADVEGGTFKRTTNTERDEQDRIERLSRIQKTFKDSTNTVFEQFRNVYIGIDLKKIIDHPGSESDLILQEGDILRIPKQQQIVKVNGEVLFSSAVVYNSSKSFRGYVSNAGGFSSSAFKRRSYVVYANGAVEGTRHFLFIRSYPKIKPGSEIVIPKKPIGRGLNLTGVGSFAASLVSAAAVLIGVISISRK